MNIQNIHKNLSYYLLLFQSFYGSIFPVQQSLFSLCLKVIVDMGTSGHICMRKNQKIHKCFILFQPQTENTLVFERKKQLHLANTHIQSFSL